MAAEPVPESMALNTHLSFSMQLKLGNLANGWMMIGSE